MIHTFQDILISLLRIETNIKGLIRLKENFSNFNTSLAKHTVDQLNQNIRSNIENQLVIIENQLTLISFIHLIIDANEADNVSRLEHDFLASKERFETLLENVNVTC